MRTRKNPRRLHRKVGADGNALKNERKRKNDRLLGGGSGGFVGRGFAVLVRFLLTVGEAPHDEDDDRADRRADEADELKPAGLADVVKSACGRAEARRSREREARRRGALRDQTRTDPHRASPLARRDGIYGA